jgi:hypothetical protein
MIDGSFGRKTPEQKSTSGQYNLESLLKEKGLEKVPEIETQFFFHGHSTTEDGQAVAERLHDADILIQENAGWDPARADIFNDVSSGVLTAQQAMDMEKQNGKFFYWKDFYKTLLDNLYESNKKVMLVDVPNDSAIFQKLMALFRTDGAYNNLIDKSLSYEETLKRIGNISKIESDLQKAREDYIMEHMPDSLVELLKENPELQKKDHLKMLFSMGGFHTRLYHEMKKSGNAVSRDFSTMPYNFDPRMSAERSIHFKGMEESQSLMPAIVLYFILKKEFPDLDLTKNTLSLFAQYEVKGIYEKYQNSSREDFVNYLESLL